MKAMGWRNPLGRDTSVFRHLTFLNKLWLNSEVSTMATKYSPMTIIGSVMSLAAFASLILGVNSYFVTKAEADELLGKVTRQQQVDRVETDISLIELEKKFLEETLEADPEDVKARKRLEYLEQRQLKLEEYQLELQNQE